MSTEGCSLQVSLATSRRGRSRVSTDAASVFPGIRAPRSHADLIFHYRLSPNRHSSIQLLHPSLRPMHHQRQQTLRHTTSWSSLTIMFELNGACVLVITRWFAADTPLRGGQQTRGLHTSDDRRCELFDTVPAFTQTDTELLFPERQEFERSTWGFLLHFKTQIILCSKYGNSLQNKV